MATHRPDDVLAILMASNCPSRSRPLNFETLADRAWEREWLKDFRPDALRSAPLDLPRRPAPALRHSCQTQRPKPRPVSSISIRASPLGRAPIPQRRCAWSGSTAPTLAGKRRHRLWLRLGRARDRSPQARRSACTGARHRSSGSAGDSRQRHTQRRRGSVHRAPGRRVQPSPCRHRCWRIFSRARSRVWRPPSRRWSSMAAAWRCPAFCATRRRR